MADISILSEHRCELGEGPFYCPRRKTLFWFDILGKKRHQHDFQTGKQGAIDLPEMTSAMAVIDDENDLLFTQTGLWKRNNASGSLSQIADIEASNSVTRSNDARVHPSGAFWLGTMGKQAQDKAGAIYHYRSGTLTKLFADISIPNAICFSVDGSTAYYTDTPTAKWMRVAVDPETGLPTSEPVVFLDYAGNKGGLDGAIVDTKNNLWIAIWGEGVVNCYSADGHLIESHKIQATKTTCPVFIDDGKIAVTSAWEGMDDGAKAADINAGKTFVLDVGASAKFEPNVVI